MTKKSSKRIPSPLKYHGGKNYLARRIAAIFPPRCTSPNAPKPDDPGWVTFGEHFAGSLAALFANDPEGISEVVNDLYGHLTTFWQVLQDKRLFDEFARRCAVTPPSEATFKAAKQLLQGAKTPSPLLSDDMRVELAWAFFVVNRQSRQALGEDFATLTRNRTRRGMNELASAWLSAVDGLAEVHTRLQRVLILNRPAVASIRYVDGPRTLHYLDPPYYPSTRSSKQCYAYEMSERAHAILLQTLLAGDEGRPWLTEQDFERLGGLEPYAELLAAATQPLQGRFVLSGYRNLLYDRAAECGDWCRTEVEIVNHSSGKAAKELKTECLWTNYLPPEPV